MIITTIMHEQNSFTYNVTNEICLEYNSFRR